MEACKIFDQRIYDIYIYKCSSEIKFFLKVTNYQSPFT